MKNKLKIYTTLLAVVLIYHYFGGIFTYEYSSWTKDADEGLTIAPLPEDFVTTKEVNGGVATYTKPLVSFEVKVKADQVAEGKYLVSNSGKNSCYLNIQKAKIKIPAERVKGKGLYYLGIFNIVIYSILAISLLVIFFKVIRSVYKAEVFVAKVARQLETAGILIFVLLLINYIAGRITTAMIIKQINIAYLNISVDYGNIIYYVIFGLVLMIVSQIILRGKELQDEQELTI
ncbi:MAG: DUF2975 domain-containing protein [Bacteroidaceae bacterium]|nr:DUF2975 domain-containing protein [Bacteroidaceae bacterium]